MIWLTSGYSPKRLRGRFYDGGFNLPFAAHLCTRSPTIASISKNKLELTGNKREISILTKDLCFAAGDERNPKA